jgi:hypothetical protein
MFIKRRKKIIDVWDFHGGKDTIRGFLGCASTTLYGAITQKTHIITSELFVATNYFIYKCYSRDATRPFNSEVC